MASASIFTQTLVLRCSCFFPYWFHHHLVSTPHLGSVMGVGLPPLSGNVMLTQIEKTIDMAAELVAYMTSNCIGLYHIASTCTNAFPLAAAITHHFHLLLCFI